MKKKKKRVLGLCNILSFLARKRRDTYSLLCSNKGYPFVGTKQAEGKEDPQPVNKKKGRGISKKRSFCH